jgi:hypothetical protein
MRQLQAVGFTLALLLLSGCSLRGPMPVLPTNPVRPAIAAAESSPSGESACVSIVFLDVAVIERPCGDRFLNHELWELGDEQAVGLETKPVLEANGFRIARLSGVLPDRLQALLASRSSCPDPRRLTTPFEEPAVVSLGAIVPECSLTLYEPSSRSLCLTQAQCQFEVVASIADDRKIRLHFTPQIRHGKPRVERQVTCDSDGSLRWSLLRSEQLQRFESLSWDLTLGSQEYVVVGARLDPADSLARAFFLPYGKHAYVQKLLVLRPGVLTDSRTSQSTFQHAPPIALQASRTPPRGLE